MLSTLRVSASFLFQLVESRDASHSNVNFTCSSFLFSVFFYCIKSSFSIDYKSSIKYSNYLEKFRVMNDITAKMHKNIDFCCTAETLKLLTDWKHNQTNWLFVVFFSASIRFFLVEEKEKQVEKLCHKLMNRSGFISWDEERSTQKSGTLRNTCDVP